MTRCLSNRFFRWSNLDCMELLSFVVIVFHFLFVLNWIFTSFAVVDESAHIASGVCHWSSGDYRAYCVNPPLPRMLATFPIWVMGANVYLNDSNAPGYRPEWNLAIQFFESNKERYLKYIQVSRVTNLLWEIPLIVVIFIWSGELFGSVGRFISLSLWCFEPTIIAFSGVVVPDIAATSAGLVSVYLFWRYLKSPKLSMAWACGLSVGLSLLTKNTMLIFYVFICCSHVILYICDLLGFYNGCRFKKIHILCFFMIPIVIVCTGYSFKGVGKKLGEFKFVSNTLSGIDNIKNDVYSDGNIFIGTIFGGIPVLLPEDYVYGIDLQKFDFERGMPSYLNGVWKKSGWWYYYIAASFVKLSFLWQIMCFIGLIFCFWCI